MTPPSPYFAKYRLYHNDQKERKTLTAYLDNSATTKVCEPAVTAAVNAMREVYGNPSSLHRMGFEAEKQVTLARKRISAALGCQQEELTFTSGATESNNLAVTGLTQAYPRRGKRIVTTALEHPSVSEPLGRLEEAGYGVVRLFPDASGHIPPARFAEAVDADTCLVAFMLVNNEIGVRFDAEEICRAVKRKNPNTLIHIDAVQGFCKVPFRLGTLQADTLSISGHKIYAPKGAGGLFVRKGVRLVPLQHGGGQEKGLRSGTESVPLIAAFGAAVADTYPNLAHNYAHYTALREELTARLAAIPEVEFNSSSDAVPYIVNFSVRGIRSEVMLHYLEQRDVYVSSGSACAKGAVSPVLSALSLPRERIDTALRVSFSPETESAHLKLLTEGLSEGIERLQRTRR